MGGVGVAVTGIENFQRYHAIVTRRQDTIDQVGYRMYPLAREKPVVAQQFALVECGGRKIVQFDQKNLGAMAET